MDEYVRATTSTLDEYYTLKTTDSTRNLFKWIEFIVMNDLPFSFVENALMRSVSNLRSICIKTLMNGLRKMFVGLKKHIGAMLPKKFGLVFDGWSSGNGAHLLGCFATFQSDFHEFGQQILLGCNQMADPTWSRTD